MAGPLSEFYSGSMLAPDRNPNGTLTQSQVYSPGSSIAQMYAGIYNDVPTQSAPGGGLTTRTVSTVPIDPQGNPAVQAINTQVPHASGSIDDGKMGYRQEPAPLNLPTPFDTHSGAAPKAPASISGMYGPTGWVDSFFGDRLGGMPINSDSPLNIGDYPANVAAAKVPVKPSISDLYAAPPAPAPAPITYAPAPFNYVAPQGSPNQSFEKQNGAGSLTQSMKDSSRWNTGY